MEGSLEAEVCGRGWESVDGDDDEAMEAHDDTTRGRIDGAARGGDESLVGLPEVQIADAGARAARKLVAEGWFTQFALKRSARSCFFKTFINLRQRNYLPHLTL